ncbi:MAG TPA: PilZ domain-containing protein [Thermodesulfovibrionales bacterium]|nr:PilZ domain-containing protein [Thermodesulfovibrionales bacterium]
MAKGGSEKRKYKRYEVDSVHGRMLYSSDINVLNISMDGAAIATTQRLSIDREYSLKLKFENTNLTFRGRVVWSVLSHSKTLKNGEVVPVYRAGIRFTGTMNDAALQLIRYIEKNKMNPLEQRILGVRFKVNGSEGAEIDLPCEYRIKKISLSGMLIETNIRLPEDSQHDMEIALDSSVVTVRGRVVNQTEIASGNVITYDVGIEFVDMVDDVLKALRAYIQTIERRS